VLLLGKVGDEGCRFDGVEALVDTGLRVVFLVHAVGHWRNLPSTRGDLHWYKLNVVRNVYSTKVVQVLRQLWVRPCHDAARLVSFCTGSYDPLGT